MNQARLFVDIDGTLAAWNPNATYQEHLLRRGYFRNLPAYVSVVQAIQLISCSRSDIELYSLSSYLTESPYALIEKNNWLEEFLPEIPPGRRIFCDYGESKAETVYEMTGQFSCWDFLLDDYSLNLHDWQASGGQGIKLLNGINGTHGTWHGPTVSRFLEPTQIAGNILNHIHIYDRQFSIA